MPRDAAHQGQHRNCRACGTNPRGQAPPSDDELRRAAFEREADENRKRLTRSDLDAITKRSAKKRIAEMRAALKSQKHDERTRAAQLWNAVDEALSPAVRDAEKMDP